MAFCDLLHENHAVVGNGTHENDRDGVCHQTEKFTAFFRKQFFNKDGHADVRAIPPAGSHAEERHINAHIAQYFVAPVEREAEDIAQNDVHRHDDRHAHHQHAGAKLCEFGMIYKINYTLHGQ
ncbi:hypothetical protein SDC9_205417 [bioreactor metagenome]|uniref:Uncharacterized protein n=1 Tax=bioreactor metagenome TaxID=1076179 RepID=A0A645JDT8_9ZZZZ